MPQRNGQNPIRKANTFESASAKSDVQSHLHNKLSQRAGICHACNTEVPPKPGFRVASLKCPKCGLPLGKK